MNMLFRESGALAGINCESWPQFTKPRPLFGLASIRRHKKAVWLSVAVCLSVALLYIASRPVTYTASTELLVYDRQIATGQDAVVLPSSVDIPLVYTQIEMLRSRTVLGKVIDVLKLTEDPEYFSPTPGVLQRLKSSLSFRPGPAIDEKTLAFVATLEALRGGLTFQRIGISHIVRANVRASRPEKAASIANELARAYLQERRRILDETSQIREAYQGLGPSAYVISAAEPPIRPDGPAAATLAVIAVLLGSGLGAMIAVLLNALDNTIRTPEQVEYCLGLECLGVIPSIKGGKLNPDRKSVGPVDVADAKNGASASITQECSGASQALWRVMAEIRGPRLHKIRVLAVTSTMPDEGATSVALNLARMLAISGEKVLLISDDHGSPDFHENSRARHSSLGVDVLTDVWSGLHLARLRELRRTDDNSLGGQLGEVVRTAMASYDIVLVDMPPLASGADVRAAAPVLDGVLLVLKWGATDSDLVRQAFQSTGEARAKFIGAVLNTADEEAVERYRDNQVSAESIESARTTADSGGSVLRSPGM
jgi:Mrp family chromosome partitioning ATPase/capsular polysaccharide biosynthesis protein